MRRSISSVFQISAIALIAGAVLALAPASDAMAAKFKVLHSFCGPHDGCDPEGGLVMDQAGNFFGTASTGGYHHSSSIGGTVYELQHTDTGRPKYTRLYSFCNRFGNCPLGSRPTGNLIVDTQGNLYGLTGGEGTVFELSPPTGGSRKWTGKLLYQFCSQQNCADGYDPVGGLAYAGQSNGALYDGRSPLYGATADGGAQGWGVAFQLTKSGGQWSETILYEFCSLGKQCADGASPEGSLIMDQAGNLYGAAELGGGNSAAGVVYQLAPQGNLWVETVLYSFCSADQCTDGAYPFGSLVMDIAGNLLGVTSSGGSKCKPDASGCGTIFKILPDGSASQENVLYAFCAKKDCKDGDGPEAGLILDSSGNLFGTTHSGGGNDIDQYGTGGGVVFELSGSSYKVLHSFCSLSNCADGEYPESTLATDGLGHIYGTTELGGVYWQGAYSPGGVVFGLTAGQAR